MQPIEINVKVTIGMENALLGLISKFTENREAAPEAGPAPKPRKQAKQVEQEPQPKPEVEKPQAEAAAPQTAQPAAKPAPAEQAAPAEQPAQSKEYTEVDVRAAMHRTRQRIEGEDYKNNTDSDGYKKYHKQLTARFKNIAALLGSDKPSTLPADQRESFINQCDELVVENGEITIICPF
jgi:hypothetical protein